MVIVYGIVQDHGMIGGKHRYNMELVANGIANIATGLTGRILVIRAFVRTPVYLKQELILPYKGEKHL